MSDGRAANHRSLNSRMVVAAAALAVVAAAALALAHRTVFHRSADPTGRYVAEVSYRSFYSLLPMPPGSSSDKPGFVEIFETGKGSLGRIPVDMLQLADIEWSPLGARVKLVGEWSFDRNSCYYWDPSGNRKIYVRGGP